MLVGPAETDTLARGRAPTLGDAQGTQLCRFIPGRWGWVLLPRAFLSEQSILIQKLPHLWGSNLQIHCSGCQEERAVLHF